MPLRNTAYLEVEHPDYGTGTFELRGAEEQHQLDREMFVGNRGQQIRGMFDRAYDDLENITSTLGFDIPTSDIGENGAGYNLDFGAGKDTISLSFLIGHTDKSNAPLWGDGSSAESHREAQGAHHQRQIDVLQNWTRTAKTDSNSPAHLHWGEWTDGTYDNRSGVFDRPIPCIVVSLSTAYESDEPSAASGTIELMRTGEFPDIPDASDIDMPGF